VTAQTSIEQKPGPQNPVPRKPQRRRASRPAGPPQEVAEDSSGSSGSSDSSASSSTLRGKARKVAGTPVKSSPLGRKQKPKSKPAVAAPVDSSATESPVPDSPVPDSPVESDKPEPGIAASGDSDAADTAVQSFGSASVSRGVSYRDRRGGGRKPDLSKRKSRRDSSGEKDQAGSGRSPRTRGNLRGLGIVLAAVVAIGLISGMVVASTLFIMGTNKIDERNDLRAEYSAFARQMITNLTTLNAENIDGAIKTFQDSTSGQAMEQTSQSMAQTVNMIKSENVSTKGTVISEAVTESDPTTGTVILVSSWEMNQPNVPEQQTVLQTFRWKLEITRINGQLKLTNFEWVT
jgi:Mce-associated membrane protein